MPDIQERLRRELTATAERIQPEMLRPLRAPRPRGLMARHARAVRLLAPVAAAAAVVGVVGSVTVASGPANGGHVAGGRNAVKPPYYVTLDSTKAAVALASRRANAVVRDSATGAVLASVKLPLELPKGYHPSGIGAVSAAADGRTFAVAIEITPVAIAQDPRPAGPPPDNQLCQFFRLRLGPGGRPVHVTRIKMPAKPAGVLPMIALSPGGTKLAVIYGGIVGSVTPIEVVNLVTGAGRTWALPPNGFAAPLSWANDRDLAFDWIPNRTRSGGGDPAAGGLRLLDTATAGNDLMAASRPILPGAIRLGDIYGAQIVPGGRTVIAVVEGSGSKSIVELAAGTGRVVRRLYGPVPAKRLPCGPAGPSPSAHHVLALCPHLVRIDNGRVTRLPVSGFSLNIAW
jgi:hypothetical protein